MTTFKLVAGSCLLGAETGCSQTELNALQMGFDSDGTNNDDRLGEIYPVMLYELNCTFGVSAVAVMVMVCGHRGLWPS